MGCRQGMFALAASALLCACPFPEADSQEAPERVELIDYLLQYPLMYSAYDGEHVYSLVASVPTDFNADGAKAIDASSLTWAVDDNFLRKAAYNDQTGAVLLTTKRVGATTITLKGRRHTGQRVQARARVEISEASAQEWALGDERFTHSRTREESSGTEHDPCGIPIDRMPNAASACADCHNSHEQTSPLPTLQTERYSDEELIAIFSGHAIPAAGVWASPVLKDAPMSECAFKLFHDTTDLDAETTRGLVWKLRSIEP